MKIIFFGTNGWYSSPTGDTPCILIDSKDYYVVLDAGNGIYKLDRYIQEQKPIHLFISHFHIDHVSGLHVLAKFDFPQGIDVHVGEGRGEDFKKLVAPPYTIGVEDKPENVLTLKTKIRLHELKDKTEEPFSITPIEQFHAYRDHSYRFILDGKTISYSGDCGITPKSRELAENADVLIHECSNVKTKDDIWGHTDPYQAAELARDSKVGKLILTHFAADQYQSSSERKKAEGEARKIFPNAFAAEDGMEFTL